MKIKDIKLAEDGVNYIVEVEEDGVAGCHRVAFTPEAIENESFLTILEEYYGVQEDKKSTKRIIDVEKHIGKVITPTVPQKATAFYVSKKPEGMSEEDWQAHLQAGIDYEEKLKKEKVKP